MLIGMINRDKPKPVLLAIYPNLPKTQSGSRSVYHDEAKPRLPLLLPHCAYAKQRHLGHEKADLLIYLCAGLAHIHGCTSFDALVLWPHQHIFGVDLTGPSNIAGSRGIWVISINNALHSRR